MHTDGNAPFVCIYRQAGMKFDNYANDYDTGWRGTKSARFYDDLIKTLEIKQGDSILDIGCGTGTVLKFISDRTNIKGFGIDLSPQMLEVAKEKNPNFDFTEGDCTNLPYENNSMDVVMTCMAYHHFADQRKFREEVYRVLKPDGMLYVCDPRFPWIVRAIFNATFKEAGFHSIKRNSMDFENSGFQVENIVKDLYVQVLTLKKITK